MSMTKKNTSRLLPGVVVALLLLPVALAFQSPTTPHRRLSSTSTSTSLAADYDNNRLFEHGTAEFSFAEKRSIESRLDRLERTAASTLQGFYEPHLNSFSVKPGSAKVSTE
jgi:hypothetical protein